MNTADLLAEYHDDEDTQFFLEELINDNSGTYFFHDGSSIVKITGGERYYETNVDDIGDGFCVQVYGQGMIVEDHSDYYDFLNIDICDIWSLRYIDKDEAFDLLQ